MSVEHEIRLRDEPGNLSQTGEDEFLWRPHLGTKIYFDEETIRGLHDIFGEMIEEIDSEEE